MHEAPQVLHAGRFAYSARVGSKLRRIAGGLRARLLHRSREGLVINDDKAAFWIARKLQDKLDSYLH